MLKPILPEAILTFASKSFSAPPMDPINPIDSVREGKSPHQKLFPQPFHVYLNKFSMIFQKFEGQPFDQVAKEVKSVFTFSRWPLVAELK